MWEKLSIVVLLSVALTGCMGLQTGEEVAPLDHSSDQATNETDSQGPDGQSQTAAGDEAANQTDEQDPSAEEEEKADEQDDGAEQTDDTAESQDDQDQEPTTPWTRDGSLELGWVAAAGANFTGQASEASAQGQQDAEHCPTARLVVPAGTGDLVITVAAQPVNASAPEDPADAEVPGAGLYTVYLHTSGGEEIYLDGTEAIDADGTNLTYSTTDPAPGPWTIEMRPMGPVVQQTWTVDAGLSGQAVDPPGEFAYETTC